MREYGMLTTTAAIYRVLGVTHPAEEILVLLRYFCDAGGWRKPATFAAETRSGSIIGRYDVPLLFPAQYGIAVGSAPKARADIAYHDPFDNDTSGLAGSVAGLPGCPIGLTGSRLAGTDQPASDIDLVVFGPDGEQIGRQIVTRYRHLGRPHSSTMLKLARVSTSPVDRITDRNVFKAVCLVDDRPTKIDIHYSPQQAIDHGSPVPCGEVITESTVCDLEVVDARGRIFFPGYLVCRHSEYGLVRLWIVDHTLQYALTGDTVTVEARVVAADGAVELVGVDLRSLTPWRRHGC